jgi:LmbE family N-acetylglucosaminyl deacetylase
MAARVTSRVLGPAQRRAADAWRNAVLAAGRDITDEAVADPRTLLVVAPHPDDETIGCSVLMARRADAGRPVTVVVVSDGETSHRSSVISPAELGRLRREESRAACATLGVTDVRFLGWSETDLRRTDDALARSLADLIGELDPGQVVLPDRRDWHPEHVIVHDAAAAGCRLAGFAGVVREYPVWSWADGPAAAPPMAPPWTRLGALVRARRLTTPDAGLVSTDGYAERKRAAFAEYRTQVTSYTSEPTWQPFPADWIDKFTGPWEAYLPHDVSTQGDQRADRRAAHASRPWRARRRVQR